MTPPKVENKSNEPIIETKENVPVRILTEQDAFLSEVMENQPQSLADIKVTPIDKEIGIHRLSLPEYFEPFSYDCTRGIKCRHHGWIIEEVHYDLEHTMKRWKQSKFGKYVFRWLLNHKRSIGEAKNIHGWLLVNRTLFSDAPKILFSINGAVEEGDCILAFMPAEMALEKRGLPSEKSMSKIKSEEERFKGNPNFYEAKLSPEKTLGDDYAPSDALQEGRDF